MEQLNHSKLALESPMTLRSHTASVMKSNITKKLIENAAGKWKNTFKCARLKTSKSTMENYVQNWQKVTHDTDVYHSLVYGQRTHYSTP